jgi:AcrR family transcriptional regulator
LYLFLEKGYKEVSYQDLIKKTGLSKGAIYYHFRSKEEIMISVFEFFLNATQQPAIMAPENLVKDPESFRKVFIGIKMDQLKNAQKSMGAGSLKFNKLLFFIEAMNENKQLKKIIAALLAREMEFLEKCFLGLKKHNQLPRGKDPALLAKNLFWMLQGAEMTILFLKNNGNKEDLIKVYKKTIIDFFKII